MSVSLGLGFLLQQRGRRHDLSRLAVAALHDVEVHPRFLHRLRGARREALDRRHLATGDRRDRRRARAQGLSVDMDGAGAALRDAASVLRAGEAELLADDPKQWSIRIAVELATRAVDVERDGHVKLLFQYGRTASQGAGQAAPDWIHAAINAPSCACVPGAGSRFPPGVHAQPTSESCAMCS